MNNKYNCDCDCEISTECIKRIFKVLLISALIIMNILLCIFIAINTNNNANGTIIPFSSTSSTGISLTTNTDGTPINMALLTFGYGQNSSAVDIGRDNMNILDFNSEIVPWETSFIMPRDGKITSVFFSYTNAEEANCYNSNTKIIVQLYSAPAESQTFYAIPETKFELNKILNGSLQPNEVITGNISNLSIEIPKNTKILMAVYLKSDSPDNINTINLLGGAHAGINIF